jgi:hypothetical protein
MNYLGPRIVLGGLRAGWWTYKNWRHIKRGYRLTKNSAILYGSGKAVGVLNKKHLELVDKRMPPARKRPRVLFSEPVKEREPNNGGIGGVYEGRIGKSRRPKKSFADVNGATIVERCITGTISDPRTVYVGCAPFDLGAMYDSIGMAILRKLVRSGVHQEITDWQAIAFNNIGIGTGNNLYITFGKGNFTATGTKEPDASAAQQSPVYSSITQVFDSTTQTYSLGQNNATWEEVGKAIGWRLRECYDVTWYPFDKSGFSTVSYPVFTTTGDTIESIKWSFNQVPYNIVLSFGQATAIDSTTAKVTYTNNMVQHVMYFNQMRLNMLVRSRMHVQNNTNANVASGTVGQNPTSAIELNNEPIFGKAYYLKGRSPITIDNVFNSLGFGAGSSVIAVASTSKMPNDYEYLPKASVFSNCKRVAPIALNPGQTRHLWIYTRVNMPFHNAMVLLEPQFGLSLAGQGQSVVVALTKRLLDDTNPIAVSFQVDRYYSTFVTERKVSYPVRYYREFAPTFES